MEVIAALAVGLGAGTNGGPKLGAGSLRSAACAAAIIAVSPTIELRVGTSGLEDGAVSVPANGSVQRIELTLVSRPCVSKSPWICPFG